MKALKAFSLTALATTTLALTACSTASSSPESSEPMSLTILHTNDHHSHLESELFTFKLPTGERVRVEQGGMARVSAEINELRDDDAILIHSGELNGTLYYTRFKGEADVALFNYLEPDAYQAGNHAFDDGEANLARLMSMIEYPMLGANIKPTEASPLYGHEFKPYVIKEVNDQMVGIIGIVKGSKTQKSSNVTDAVVFLDEQEVLEQAIAELEAQGVNKIVFLSHMGFNYDLEMMKNVSGVDVIVGGDTHTMLDSSGKFEALGLKPEGPNPVKVTAPDGNPVCISQAWEYAHGLGIMEVDFDENGVVENCDAQLRLLIGDTIEIRDENKVYHPLPVAEFEAMIGGFGDAVKQQSEDPKALKIIAPYTAELETFRSQELGFVADELPFDRIPEPFAKGDAISGSLAAQVVTDAMYEFFPDVEIAIQNGGGVRSKFQQGLVTAEHVYTMLPFGNTLVKTSMTGANFKRLLEDAIEFALHPDGSSGAFPYASHARYAVDSTQPFGNRVSGLEFKVRGTDSWVPFDMHKTYVVATNNFVATGKDGYDTFAEASAADPSSFEDSYVTLANMLIDYIGKLEGQTIQPITTDEYSIVSYK